MASLDAADFTKMFRYNHGVRAVYLERLPELLPWDELAKNRETAWLSIKDTMLHIIRAEDTWVTAIRCRDLTIRIGPFSMLPTARGTASEKIQPAGS